MENASFQPTASYWNVNFTQVYTNTTDHQESVILRKRHLIGVILAVVGNCLISVALNLQKHAHNKIDDGANYCTNKTWWIGMVAMGIGEVGNFLAYGFAPASLVAPLGCVGVVANAIIAFVFLKEQLSAQGLMGVSLIAAGSYVLISFSTRDHAVLTVNNIETYLKNTVFIVYIVVEAITLAVILYFIKYKEQETLVTLLVVVAILASVTVISAKGVSTMLTATVITRKQHVFNAPFWIMLASLPFTIVPQIRYLNRAMQLHDVSDVVPVNFIFFTLSAIFAGTVFYQEFHGLPATKIVMFIFGCVVSFIGVFIIMRRGGGGVQNKKEENTCLLSSTDDGEENPHQEEAGSLPRRMEKQSTHMLKQLVNMVKQTETIQQIQPISAS